MKITKLRQGFGMKFQKGNNRTYKKFMQKFLIGTIALFFFGTVFGQSIEKTWEFSEVKDQNDLSILNITPEKDYLKLENGTFEYQLTSSDSLKSSGDYILQNNLLVLFFNKPNDSIRRFRVEQVTDSTLALSENNHRYQLKIPEADIATVPAAPANSSEIKPSKGFSSQSLWRGILGMVSLLLIARSEERRVGKG